MTNVDKLQTCKHVNYLPQFLVATKWHPRRTGKIDSTHPLHLEISVAIDCIAVFLFTDSSKVEALVTVSDGKVQITEEEPLAAIAFDEKV